MGVDNDILEQLRELEVDIYDKLSYDEDYLEYNKDEILRTLIAMIEVVRDI